MLSVKNVSKWFGTRRVLEDVTLDVARGERVVLLGENGSGKSTLLQIVAGILEAYEGSISVPASIGYAPERPDMPDHLLAGEWLDLVASLKRASWSDAFGVRPLLGRKIGALSLGQRQRVSLVAAFTGAQSLVVLDEPTNALDDDARDELVSRVCSATALVATHDLAFADRVGTRVLRMPLRSTLAGV